MQEWTKLIGKTIEKIDDSSVNIVILYFTDGTSFFIEPEHQGHGIYGPVLYPTLLLGDSHAEVQI